MKWRMEQVSSDCYAPEQTAQLRKRVSISRYEAGCAGSISEAPTQRLPPLIHRPPGEPPSPFRTCRWPSRRRCRLKGAERLRIVHRVRQPRCWLPQPAVPRPQARGGDPRGREAETSTPIPEPLATITSALSGVAGRTGAGVGARAQAARTCVEVASYAAGPRGLSDCDNPPRGDGRSSLVAATVHANGLRPNTLRPPLRARCRPHRRRDRASWSTGSLPADVNRVVRVESSRGAEKAP